MLGQCQIRDDITTRNRCQRQATRRVYVRAYDFWVEELHLGFGPDLEDPLGVEMEVCEPHYKAIALGSWRGLATDKMDDPLRPQG